MKVLVHSLKNEKQKEVFQWLVHHSRGNLTALDTWNLLLQQRNSKAPDVCIEIYDGLSFIEKVELEYAFSKYVYNSIFGIK